MKLKRYSPKSAAAYLRDYAATVVPGHFTDNCTADDKVALGVLETLLAAECLKWANHIDGLRPTKALLGEILQKDRARFWDLHCQRKFVIGHGYSQVTSGRTSAQMYAEWLVIEVVNSMFGD